jgi:phytoene synthase
MSSSFAPAFWLLPAERREALFALHGFCRAADDAVDDRAGGVETAARRLAGIRQDIDGLFGGREVTLPETRALAPYVERFQMERAHLDRLLDALARDLDGSQVATEEELIEYCEGVASSPGYLALSIFECNEAQPYARALGIALQCTNILRDIREDLEDGRVYLPVSDLEKVDLSRSDLGIHVRERGGLQPLVQELLRLHKARTTVWFEAADAAYRMQSRTTRRKLVAARGMQRIYRGLFDRLEKMPVLPMNRLRPGRFAAIAALLTSWSEAHWNPA